MKYVVNDTGFHFWHGTFAAAEHTYRGVLTMLRRLGFTIRRCEYTHKHYRCLTKHTMRANYGDLRAKIHVSGIHTEAIFYQDLVTENRNGGEYDFDKLEKMPYPIKLRWLWTRERIEAALREHGITNGSKKQFEDCTPLEWFNQTWTAERFDRGTDGWPSEKELRSWSRLDGDGNVLGHGETRYTRVRGRWLRCQVYGGINGMWQCYTNGRCINTASAPSLRSLFPGRGRMFEDRERGHKLKQALDMAVKAKDFMRAHKINGMMTRETSTGDHP